MPQNPDHIAVNDLLGRPPGWMLHSGITLVFLIVAGALTISAYIHYPDELNGRAVIQYEQAPVMVAPITTAILDTLFHVDGDAVKTEQLLGVLQSDANWREVLDLDKFLSELDNNELPEQLPVFQNLGVLQSVYANWVASASGLKQFESNNGIQRQHTTIVNEIAYTRDLIKITENRLALLDEQIALETTDYNRQTLLAEQGVISTQDYENKKKAWLAIRQQRENQEANLVQYRLKINQLEQQSDNLHRGGKDDSFTLRQNYIRANKELNGQIQSWKERYLLVAPLSGQLVFATDIIEKQIAQAGQTLFSIQPELAKETSLIARINIPAQGLGKIAVGDKIVLRLDAYPEKEFGTVNTQLDHIAALPQVDNNGQSFYQLEASISKPIETNYGKILPLEILMSGTGTVITKDRSVLDRVFEQLLDLMKQNQA